MLDNKKSQTFAVQTIVKEFVDRKIPNFAEFTEVLRKFNGSKLIEYTSPLPLVFGRLQSAVQTFIGFIKKNANELEEMAGFFGVYYVYRAQNLTVPEPIIITPEGFNILKNKAKKHKEVQSMFTFLVNSGAFSFSAKSYAIPTPFTDVPPDFVPDIQPHFYSFQRTKKEKAYQNIYNNTIDEAQTEHLTEQYSQLMREIFEK